MSPFFLLSLGIVAGTFTISQSFAQAAVFDFYFYMLPFGMALVGLFTSAGVLRMSWVSSVALLRVLPLCGTVAILASVALYVYGGGLGISLFFPALIVIQALAYVSLGSVVVEGGRPVLSATGFVSGVALGYALIAYRNVDPLVVGIGAAVLCAALYLAAFLKQKLQMVAFGLLVCIFMAGVLLAGKGMLMPASLGWMLDYGKTGTMGLGDWGKQIWGPAGLTQVRTLNSDGRDAWLYTNGVAPSLVPLGDPAGYDDAWWAQKAPLTLALFNAVRPKSIVDIGAVPGEVTWRAVGSGTRDIYGLYASQDWSSLRLPGLDSIRRKVVPLRQSVRSAVEEVKRPVDMIVLSSGHEGKGGWTSSISGEQMFLDQDNILRYWGDLAQDGVLVLLSRDQPVFFRQIFTVHQALKGAGMNDAEFLDHAWGIVPDTDAADSPYRYALVLTKKRKDEHFAQVIREQVVSLPVKYLFGFAIPPSRPYDYFYQNPFGKVEALFSQGVSGMFGKQMSLGAPGLHRSVPYQLVEDVYPPYKNFLVLSVGIFVSIILFPLQKRREIGYVRTLQEPGVAAWMVEGGAVGAVATLALALLLAYPSDIQQQYRMLFLGPVILLAMVACRYLPKPAIMGRVDALLALTSVFGLILFLMSHFAGVIEGGGGYWAVGLAGALFVLPVTSLEAARSALSSESQAPLLPWWYFAAAAGGAMALFGSVGLYAVLGDGVLAFASLLLIVPVMVLGWARLSRTARARDAIAVRQETVLCRQG